jgi:hypothetical protein
MRYSGKNHFLGYFTNELDAARAYTKSMHEGRGRPRVRPTDGRQQSTSAGRKDRWHKSSQQEVKQQEAKPQEAKQQEAMFCFFANTHWQ